MGSCFFAGKGELTGAMAKQNASPQTGNANWLRRLAAGGEDEFAGGNYQGIKTMLIVDFLLRISIISQCQDRHRQI